MCKKRAEAISCTETHDILKKEFDKMINGMFSGSPIQRKRTPDEEIRLKEGIKTLIFFQPENSGFITPTVSDILMLIHGEHREIIHSKAGCSYIVMVRTLVVRFFGIYDINDAYLKNCFQMISDLSNPVDKLTLTVSGRIRACEMTSRRLSFYHDIFLNPLRDISNPVDVFVS